MNFLFGIGIALPCAIAFLVGASIFASQYHKLTGKNIPHQKQAIRAISAVIFFVVVFTSLQSYGPRLTVSSSPPVAPEREVVKDSEDIFDSPDHKDVFDRKIKSEADRQP